MSRNDGRFSRRLQPAAICLALAALAAGAPCAAAGRDDPGERPHWRKNIFKRFFTDQKYLFTTWIPHETPRKQFYIPMLATLAVAAQSSGRGGFDYELQEFIERDPDNHDLPDFFTDVGDVAIGVVGISYLAGRWADNDRLARASSLSAEAFFNTLLWGDLLKELSRRTRPADGGDGEFFVANPQDGQNNTSFPSGHAIQAFSIASVFAWEYREKKWVPWVAYGTAGLIAWSRVSLGRHFPSDVVAGGLLGHFFGRMVISREVGFERRSFADNIRPFYDPIEGGYGLMFSRSW